MARKPQSVEVSDGAEPSKRSTTASAMALAISKGSSGLVERLGSKLERRTLPNLVKPGDMPVGAELLAKLIRVMPSMRADIKGELMWLRTRDQVEFLFPITGQINQALPHMNQEIGKWVLLRRGPDEMSEKYKKPMFAFEVWTLNEADLDAAS